METGRCDLCGLLLADIVHVTETITLDACVLVEDYWCCVDDEQCAERMEAM